MNKPDYQARLTDIALAEQTVEFLVEDRADMYADHISEFDHDIEVSKNKVDKLRASLKADTLTYVEEGGESKGLHPAIVYRVKSVLKYDRAAMTTECIKVGLDTVLKRPAPTLIVKKFEAMMKGLDYVWPGVETVERREVAIDSNLRGLLHLHSKDDDDASR